MLRTFFFNRDIILCFALFLGLFFPGCAQWMKPLIIPMLALVMTLSAMGVSSAVFSSPRGIVIPLFFGVFMNYCILSGFILAMSTLLVADKEIWKGFLILAAAPPAVAIIPFTEFLEGDRTYSLIGTTGAYLAALIIMPLMTLGFLGSNFLEPKTLLVVVIELIIVPFVVSRVLLWKGIDKFIEPVKGGITNWSFFVVVYTIVGLNQDIFIQQPFTLVPVAFIAVLSTFFLGLVVEWIAKRKGLDRAKTTSLVLMGTLKNYGLAGGLSLAFFGQKTALPAAVSTVCMILYIIWLGFKRRG